MVEFKLSMDSDSCEGEPTNGGESNEGEKEVWRGNGISIGRCIMQLRVSVPAVVSPSHLSKVLAAEICIHMYK